MTIPVGRNHSDLKIYDVSLPGDKKWMQTHWKTITQNYTKAEFFSHYRDFFEGLYQKDFEYLWQINAEIISYLLRCFEIDTEVITTREMDLAPELQGTNLLVTILKSIGADTYLSGPSGKNYLDVEKFHQNNIDLRFFEFQHPVYKQTYPGFEPAMAAIDLLFNAGPQASKIIKASGDIRLPVSSSVSCDDHGNSCKR